MDVISYKKAKHAEELAQEIIDGQIDVGVLQTKINEKLGALETQYAPDLVGVKTGLADIAKKTGINILDYSSFATKSNGLITDWKPAIEKAVSDLNTLGGGYIVFPYQDYPLSNAVITGINIHLYGFGYAKIKNGTFKIGTQLDPVTNTTVPTGYVTIDGFLFDNDTVAGENSNKNGIELANCGHIRIQNNRFHYCDKAIYVYPLWATQHVNRTLIQDNFINDCNYGFYVANPNQTGLFFIGDFHFKNNQVTALYYNIYGSGIDGFVCKGNTFFMPSGNQSTTTQSNIYLDYYNWVIIEGNQLFEAGLDGLQLNRGSNAVVNGNNIAWCGQRLAGSGIRITGGDYLGSSDTWATISNNNISEPSLHGISIEGTSGNVKIASDNQIRNVGSITRYYGGGSLPSAYGLNVESTTKDIQVPYLDVKWFGAKINGTTDDTNAIHKAIQMASMLNVSVPLPKGNIKANIFIAYDNIQLIGSGMPIYDYTNNKLYMGTVINGQIDCNGKKNVLVRDLGVDSSVANVDAIIGGGSVGVPLNQTFDNVAILGGGYAQQKHGFLFKVVAILTYAT
jgi:hypothetical protein